MNVDDILAAFVLPTIVTVSIWCLFGDDNLDQPWRRRRVESLRLPYTDAHFTSMAYAHLVDVIKAPGGMRAGQTRKEFVDEFVEANDIRGDGTRDNPYRFPEERDPKAPRGLRAWWGRKVAR